MFQIKLRCPVEGYPLPAIQWLKDGVPVEQIARPSTMRPYVIRPEKWELKIHGLRKSDQGKYTCILSNSKGMIKHTYRIEVLDYVQDKPILVKQSNNLTLLTGMTANFDCKFQADLALLVHWLRPTEAIRNSMNETEMDGSNPDHFETIEDRPGHSYTGENFTIENVQPEDAGLYFCVGQTNAGMTPGI